MERRKLGIVNRADRAVNRGMVAIVKAGWGDLLEGGIYTLADRVAVPDPIYERLLDLRMENLRHMERELAHISGGKRQGAV